MLSAEVLGIWRRSLEKDRRFPAAPAALGCWVSAHQQVWWGVGLPLPFLPIFCSSFGFARADAALGRGEKQDGWDQRRSTSTRAAIGHCCGCDLNLSPAAVAAVQEQGGFSEHQLEMLV